MAANVDKRSFKQGCLFFLEPFQIATIRTALYTLSRGICQATQFHCKDMFTMQGFRIYITYLCYYCII